MDALQRAAELGIAHLASLDDRPVFPSRTADELRAVIDVPLPDEGVDPVTVVEDLASGAAPGLVASPGSRYFGFVTGGAVPASVGADWLVSAWDQNAFSFVSSPAVSVIESVAARWVLEILDLPHEASVAFVTGCQMAHVTGLAAARHDVLRRVGWDVPAAGLYGAPPVTVVAGADRHVSVDRALRLLGMGEDCIVPVESDVAARMRPDALTRTLASLDGPVIVAAQAGEVNTGSFDPLRSIIEVAHSAGAWVHVDAAFGMWARAEPSLRHLTDGIEGADSWAFDAHKWLNVPYDSGVAVVAHQAPHRAAMLGEAAYHVPTSTERDAYDWTPDASRRARGVPVYAALRSLGRKGVADLVERCCSYARSIADDLSELGLEVLNEVILNQVLVRAASDDLTLEVLRRVQAGGEAWMGGTIWEGRPAIRISVSGWKTTSDDVLRTIEAFRSAL